MTDRLLIANMREKIIKVRLIDIIYLFVSAILLFYNFGKSNNRIINEVLNYGHIPLFGIMSLVVLRMQDNGEWPITNKRYYLIAGIITALVGIITEFIQSFIPWREYAVRDIINDVLGIASFLVFVYPFPAKQIRIKIFCKNACIVFIIGAMVPMILTMVDLWHIKRDFPLICSFESAIEISRWGTTDAQIALSKLHATHRKFSMKVKLSPGNYPGVSTKYLAKNWQGYDELSFDVFLEGDRPLTIMVRIKDKEDNIKYEGEYCRRFFLASGPNHIMINLTDILHAPKDRTMDMNSICLIHIFSDNLKEYRILYMDNLRLSMGLFNKNPNKRGFSSKFDN